MLAQHSPISVPPFLLVRTRKTFEIRAANSFSGVSVVLLNHLLARCTVATESSFTFPTSPFAVAGDRGRLVVRSEEHASNSRF